MANDDLMLDDLDSSEELDKDPVNAEHDSVVAAEVASVEEASESDPLGFDGSAPGIEESDEDWEARVMRRAVGDDDDPEEDLGKLGFSIEGGAPGSDDLDEDLI